MEKSKVKAQDKGLGGGGGDRDSEGAVYTDYSGNSETDSNDCQSEEIARRPGRSSI